MYLCLNLEFMQMRCYFLTAQRLDTESSMEAVIGFQMNKGKEDVYFAIRGSKTADDVILIERNRERNIQRWKVASKKYCKDHFCCFTLMV